MTDNPTNPRCSKSHNFRITAPAKENAETETRRRISSPPWDPGECPGAEARQNKKTRTLSGILAVERS